MKQQVYSLRGECASHLAYFLSSPCLPKRKGLQDPPASAYRGVFSTFLHNLLHRNVFLRCKPDLTLLAQTGWPGSVCDHSDSGNNQRSLKETSDSW